jgi:quinol monooxygenase YgiN
MLNHYGPACVVEHGMLRYWLHHEDGDEAHVLLYEQWAHLADTEGMWDEPRIVTTYRWIQTDWEPLDPDGLPESLGR